MEAYQDTKKETAKNIGKGILISMIFTVICLFVFSIVLTYTNISENTIIPVIIVVTAISILIRKFNWKY